MDANTAVGYTIMYIYLIIFVAGIIMCLALLCCYFICGPYQEQQIADPTINTDYEIEFDDATEFSHLHRAAVAALSNIQRQ